MPFDAVFLADRGEMRWFFLRVASRPMKSVVCAVQIFMRFTLLTALFQNCPDDDGCKKQYNDTGRHGKGDGNTNQKQKCANNTAAQKRNKPAEHDNGKQSGKQDGGDFVHKVRVFDWI